MVELPPAPCCSCKPSTLTALWTSPQLLPQLNELDRVLDFLEQMDLRDQTEMPTKATEMRLG